MFVLLASKSLGLLDRVRAVVEVVGVERHVGVGRSRSPFGEPLVDVAGALRGLVDARDDALRLQAHEIGDALGVVTVVHVEDVCCGHPPIIQLVALQ
jgi:hypothetical protein